jgi:glycosyltransferase involved in cell wall biosynthesis
MRIAILSYEYPPETGYGGIGTYSWYQARALVRLGHEVHVFAGSVEAGVRNSTHDGVQVTRIKQDGWLDGMLGDVRRSRAWWFQNRVTTAAATYKALRREHDRKPFDFVEAPECGADAMVSTTLLRVPTMVRFHSPAKLIMGLYETSRTDRELTAFAEQIAINQAQLLTSCSQFLADEVRNGMGERKPIHVVPNGIDVQLFDRDEGIDVEQRFGLPRDKKLILFANRMEERKGIHVVRRMVEATLAKHPDIAFVFAGRDPSGWMERRILPWVRDRQLQDRFLYLGQIGLPEVRACLKRAAIFLVPSLWENCPYSCIEAMTAGCAVVASDCGGLPELIRHEQTGLLARTGDAEDFVATLERLLGDPGLQDRCGAGARAFVERNLTDVGTAARCVELYRGWLEQDRRHTGAD